MQNIILKLLVIVTLLFAACRKDDLPRGSAFFYPNSFTPNNDGINDIWIPIGGVDVNADKFELVILCKNNKTVFLSDSFNNAWNGHYNGAMAPSGYYFFVVTYEMNDGQKFRDAGMIELIK